MILSERDGRCRVNLEGAPIEGVAVLNARSLGVTRRAEATRPRWEASPLPREGLTVHILGLGDVGATLLTGLTLLGGGVIKSIGLLDPNRALCRRYELEMNQILPALDAPPPRVRIIAPEELFQCDAVAFTASKSVPPVGTGAGDVRLAQRDANKALIAPYARMAREAGFTGLFAVVSDPVDLLCRHVYLESRRDGEGNACGGGLKAEQIRGFGLGVMAARARYAGVIQGLCPGFDLTGRVYGPHGAALVVANDTGEGYDQELSMELTRRTVDANLRVRELGFKPYIAPGLSSAAISLMRYFRREWCLSALPLGDVYFGCKSRLDGEGLTLEAMPMNELLYGRLLAARDWLREHT